MAEKMTVERAKDIMLGQGFHCSQVIVMHACDLLGMDPALGVKMAGGLGGGLFQGEVCGCVSAAVLALGLVYGYNEPGSREQNAILTAKVKEFEQKFTERHGTLLCRGILGYSLGIPEEAQILREKGIIRNTCPALVTDTCAILDEMLAKQD